MFALHLQGRREVKKVVWVVVVFEDGSQKSKTSKGLDFLGSLSPQKMGLGGVEVALPATLNFLQVCFFLQLCIILGLLLLALIRWGWVGWK